jgi:hypothetical protein
MFSAASSAARMFIPNSLPAIASVVAVLLLVMWCR